MRPEIETGDEGRWAARSGGTKAAKHAGERSPFTRRMLGPVSRLLTTPGRAGPALLVLLPILFQLWTLRAELLPVTYPNDGSLHLQMIRWAQLRIEQGHLPLDGWYPYQALGSSQFHHYQSLPHIISGGLAVIFGADLVYRWSLYLLLALWPLSVYWGARLLGWNRWPSAAAGLVSPLLVSASGYGFELGSYTWRGYGIWPQLWAMWLLPLAWGLTWRAVTQGRFYALAALSVALTIACHFMVGYVALLMVPVWALMAGPVARRLLRASAIVAGALAIASWQIVPVLADLKFTAQSAYIRGTALADSFGAGRVLRWLFTGQLYDAGRFPIVSLLVATGVIVCATRFAKDERARALLLAWIVGLVLFSGRPTLGPSLRLLPGDADLQLQRFIVWPQMAGVLLAGVGAAWLGNLLFRRARALLPAVRPVVVAGAVLLAVIVALAPAWIERWRYDATGSEWIAEQRAADRTQGPNILALIDQAKAMGGGRIYGGARGGWGDNYRVGFVPVYALLANRGADEVGFPFRTIGSLSTDVEPLFDEHNLADYQLFNVKYLILPQDRKPAVPATLIATRGQNTLWSVETSGFLQLADTVGSIEADRANIGTAAAAFVASDLPHQGLYKSVAFAGAPAAAPTAPADVTPTRPPGVLDHQVYTPADGLFGGDVTLSRPGVVVLKASFDPRWRVFVDGIQASSQMIAPSFVGAELPAGSHSVLFFYGQYPFYGSLFAVALLALIVLRFGPQLRFGSQVTDRNVAGSPQKVSSQLPPLSARRATGSRARPVGLTLVGVALFSTLALGFALKAPCMFGDRSDGRAYLHYCYTDIAPLFEARQLDQHELPYLRSSNEYPVLTGMLMWSTALPAHTEQQFSVINVAVLTLVAGVVALLLCRQVGYRALYFAAAPTLLLYAFMNWDLLPVLLTTLAIVAFRSRRDVAAGVLLGLAVAAKVYPVLFLIPFVADRLHEGRRRSAAHLLFATGGSWLAVNLPFAVLSFRGWSEFFRFSSARPTTAGTLWFIGCHTLTGGECGHVALINVLSLVAFLIGAAFVWRLRTAKRPALWRWDIGFPLIVVFLLTNKVYSPQYSLWLLPWFALVLPDLTLFLAFTAADAAVFLMEFSYAGTSFGLGGVPLWALELAVAFRAAVLVWCVIASERRPRAEPTAMVGSPSAPPPAGV